MFFNVLENGSFEFIIVFAQDFILWIVCPLINNAKNRKPHIQVIFYVRFEILLFVSLHTVYMYVVN